MFTIQNLKLDLTGVDYKLRELSNRWTNEVWLGVQIGFFYGWTTSCRSGKPVFLCTSSRLRICWQAQGSWHYASVSDVYQQMTCVIQCVDINGSRCSWYIVYHTDDIYYTLLVHQGWLCLVNLELVTNFQTSVNQTGMSACIGCGWMLLVWHHWIDKGSDGWVD